MKLTVRAAGVAASAVNVWPIPVESVNAEVELPRGAPTTMSALAVETAAARRARAGRTTE
jgi:hypothetical protein